LFLFIFLVSVSACGKKGPPTLKAYEKPPAPLGLTAYHRGNMMILSWSYPDNLRSAVKDFQVLRAHAGGFERIGTAKSSQSSFIDESFTLDITYHYKVVAQNQMGISSTDSNIITVTPKPVPATPEDIRFEVKADSIALSWKSSGEGACYNIYKTAEKGKYGEAPLNKEPVCPTSFTDRAVTPERPVYYTVRALRMTDIRDEGSASEELEVNPSQFVPSAPSDLRVVRGEKIYLMWKESPEPWVKGYRVYRKKEGEADFTPIATVIIPSFTDVEKTDKRVWYMIKAVGPVSESEALAGEAAK
jgi:hypothetical protein